MPEGDTLFRTATVLREVLAGKPVTAARGRPDGVALGRVVGSSVERVESVGKHLLITFGGGLALHTHLRMHGSWHRYRAGERWRRSPARAVAVIEVPSAVAVCFDAPTVELLDARALGIHPALAALGPDLIEDAPDLDEAMRRMRDFSRVRMTIGEALLDQRSQAGLGNVYRSEICFIGRVDPFAEVAAFDDATLRRSLETGARLLAGNRGGAGRTTTPDPLGAPVGAGGPRPAGGRLYVYGRSGRPCRRCGTPIRSRVIGELPRRAYWCPGCQPEGAGTASGTRRSADPEEGSDA
ncbi:MAG: Fpg/Nei family DNA glycosylase [Chloroflexi bacterium]|nr:Fpg/Nei family DNA glycosylase [Chloroflexota bacterium]